MNWLAGIVFALVVLVSMMIEGADGPATEEEIDNNIGYYR